MSFNHRLNLTSQETIILKISEISCLIVILKSELLPISIELSYAVTKYFGMGHGEKLSICQG